MSLGCCSQSKMWLVLFWAEGKVLHWDCGATNDWLLVNKKAFGPQGVKQVMIFRFAFVWIKWGLTFIIIKGKACLNPHWLPVFSYFRLFGGSPKWGLVARVGQLEPTIFKEKMGSNRNFEPQSARVWQFFWCGNFRYKTSSMRLRYYQYALLTW